MNDLVFPIWCHYKNEIDYIDRLLSIYSISTKKEKDRLRPFEKKVLIYYIRHGYNSETKERIKKELDKTSANINQANFHLKNKGYLVQSLTNHQNKKLSKDLQVLRDELIEGKKRIMAVGFKRQ